MTSILLMLPVAFLSAFGLVVLVQRLIAHLSCTHSEMPAWLIRADADSADVEMQIKYARRLLSWCPGAAQKRIIVLDNGMSEEQKAIALLEARDDPRVQVMALNELKKM